MRAPTITDHPTEKELQLLSERLDRFNRISTNDRIQHPGTEDPGVAFDLAVRGSGGVIVGGVRVSSVFDVMWLEALWVDERYRGRGIGSWLILEAERVAYAKGCVGAGTWTLDWQGAAFYPQIGFELNGIYDGYPAGMTEHVLSKLLPSSDAIRRKVEERAHRNRQDGFALTTNPTGEEMQIVRCGLHEYCVAHVGDEMNNARINVCLILRDERGELIGGLTASTTIRILALKGDLD